MAFQAGLCSIEVNTKMSMVEQPQKYIKFVMNNFLLQPYMLLQKEMCQKVEMMDV
jgi:hypothetical protein